MKDVKDIKWLNEQLKKLHDEVTILRQEQKQYNKEKELSNESELEYKRLIYQLSIPFEIFNSNGDLVFANRAFLEMWSIPSEELIINKFNILYSGIVGPDELKEIKAAFSGEIINLKHVEVNFKNINKNFGFQRDGKGTFELNLFPIYGTSGKIKFVAAIWNEFIFEDSDTKILQTFKSALDVSANGIMITNYKGDIIWVNKAFTYITGYEKEEALGNNPRLLKSGVQEKEFYQNLWATITSGRIWKGEIIEKKKDGSMYSELETITPVKNSYGNIENYVAIKVDISEQKKYEIELERLNRALKTISACNSVLIHSNSEPELLEKICKLIIETGGYYFTWIGLLDENNQFHPVSFNGYEDGYLDIIFSQIKSMQNNFIPLFKAVVEKKYIVIKDIKNDPEFTQWKSESLKRNYASVAAIPLITGDNVLGILCIYSDQTDSFNKEELILLNELSDDLSFGINSLRIKKEHEAAVKALGESEKKYRLFFEQDLAGDYISTQDGKILDCNDSFLKIFGFTSITEAKNYNAADLHSNTEIRTSFIERIKNEKWIQSLELKMRTFDGRIIYVIENAWGTFDENGNLMEVKGYFQDITKRKIAEEALKEAKEIAEESDRLKTEFLAQMSHEIRTPVNVILSYNSLLREELNDIMPPEWNTAFNSIELAGRRLIRTIDLILNMSMIQTGRTELNSDKVDIHFVLLNLIHEFQSITGRKNLELVLLNKVENTTFNSDEYILTHVFQNLIDNAIKYTSNGKVEIIIYNDVENNLCVDIRDTGIGMSSEYLSRMFKPFSQEDTGYSRKYEGVGLGLAIVKKYLDLLGASINVESERGKGSVFTITFYST